MTTDIGRIPDCPEHSWDQQAKGGVYLHHSTHQIDPQDNSHRHTTWLVCRTFRKMDLGENTQFQIQGFWSGTRGRKSLSPPRPQLLPLQPQRTGPAQTDRLRAGERVAPGSARGARGGRFVVLHFAGLLTRKGHGPPGTPQLPPILPGLHMAHVKQNSTANAEQRPNVGGKKENRSRWKNRVPFDAAASSPFLFLQIMSL